MRNFVLFLSMVFCVVFSTQAGLSHRAPIEFTRNPNFMYEHTTAVMYNGFTSFPVVPAVERVAKIINRDLGQSMFFNTEFLSDILKVRRYHVKKKPNKANMGSLMWVTTSDNIKLGCTYFNRGSDTLLLVGGGFTNARDLTSSPPSSQLIWAV